MPHIEYLLGPAPFTVSAQTAQSFAIAPRIAKLTAPGTLIRFIATNDLAPGGPVGRISRYAGRYWFDADLLATVRTRAYTELSQQRNAPGGPTANTLNDLIGLYIRLYLRESLAICKNWKENFDGYVTLTLPPGASLTALVGPIAEQPYYDATSPDYPRAADGKVRLRGGVTQYYVDFNHPANRVHAPRISPPIRF